MTRKGLHQINIALGITRLVGMGTIAVGAFICIGTVGTSDLEAELMTILHPYSWYVLHEAIGMGLVMVGLGVVKSCRPLWRWIKRTNYIWELGKRAYHEERGEY